MTTTVGLHVEDDTKKESVILGSDTLVLYTYPGVSVVDILNSQKNGINLDKLATRSTIYRNKLFVAEDDSLAFVISGATKPEFEMLTLFDKLLYPQKYSLPPYKNIQELLGRIKREYESFQGYSNEINLNMSVATRFDGKPELHRVRLNSLLGADNLNVPYKAYSLFGGSGGSLAREASKVGEIAHKRIPILEEAANKLWAVGENGLSLACCDEIHLLREGTLKERPLHVSLEEGVTDVLKGLTAAQKDIGTKGYAMVVVDKNGIRNPFFPDIEPQEKADWRMSQLYLDYLKQGRRTY